MKETITNLLRSNTTTIIYGMSGWGKSQIVEQAAKELNMDCKILSLAGVAPEDFGIPAVKEGYYEYLPPKWVVDFYESGKDFVLFLDEITQATIQVMHAVYPLVLNKRIGDFCLPKMRVIAASNYDYENPHLTTIMKPLLNRFDVELKIEEDFGQTMVDDFWAYISGKYQGQISLIEMLKSNVIATNPRAYEAGINFLQNNPGASDITKLVICRKAFGELANVVLSGYKQDVTTNETHDQDRVMKAGFAYKNNVIAMGGALKMNPSRDEIAKYFNLSDEEKECVFI